MLRKLPGVLSIRTNISLREMKTTNIIALIGSLYSFYALYGSGYEAMMWDSIVTFLGWSAYGLIAAKHEPLAN